MKSSKVLKSILFIAGLIAVGIGAVILFMPATLFASNGVALGLNPNLLNEIRPPGGALLASGVLILVGVFVTKLTFTATVVSTLLYLSYGVSRVLSIAMDGMPAASLLQALAVEIIIGLLCGFALVKYRETA